MSNAEMASWVQALGALLAIIIAIWTVRQQANRERDNRIIDDAAFASYIDHHLSSDIGKKVEDISSSIEISRDMPALADVSNDAVNRYKEDVLNRLEKLSDMPLTDWPDIQFANSFSDTYLRMKSDFVKLCKSRQQVFSKADEELARKQREAARRLAEKRRIEEADEDYAEEYLGSIDDGLSIALPSRGQRMAFVDRKRQSELSDDDHFEPADYLRAQAEAENLWVDKQWDEQSERFARETLRDEVFEPLRNITKMWSNKASRDDRNVVDAEAPDFMLRQAIDRYVERARRFNLPTTYDGRAERPRKLMSILK